MAADPIDLKKLWAPVEALEARIGPEAALASYRPGEVAGRARTAPPLPLAEGFEIVEAIGRGGMGIVYRAEQASLGRMVAVKQPTSLDPAVVAQFLSEARLTGRLEHANIVAVHLLGQTAAGAPLLAMKLVDGTSWRDLLHTDAGAGLDLKDHLEILLGVCNAVAYAHAQGFLHRDLKPENVMVAPFGQVVVMDWGIAVGTDAEACRRHGIVHVSEVTSPAGTPSYMAPELASGDGRRQDARTDVFLLGACLHEVLTRRQRHTGESVYEILVAASESRPVDYDASVPWELADVCNRATARDPADRFPSVAELRAALSGYLDRREAHALASEGIARVEALRGAVAGLADGPPATRPARTLAIERAHAEATFALDHALARIPDDRRATAARREADELLEVARRAVGR